MKPKIKKLISLFEEIIDHNYNRLKHFKDNPTFTTVLITEINQLKSVIKELKLIMKCKP